MQGPGSDTAGVMKEAVQPVMEAVLRGDTSEAQRHAQRVANQFGATNSSHIARGFLGVD